MTEVERKEAQARIEGLVAELLREVGDLTGAFLLRAEPTPLTTLAAAGIERKRARLRLEYMWPPSRIDLFLECQGTWAAPLHLCSLRDSASEEKWGKIGCPDPVVQ